ncbi:MAG: hypothetical protein KC419_24110 [Anaerolineales bacterium]|nr:hypothetical protein [Anaerolineales bacterium]
MGRAVEEENGRVTRLPHPFLQEQVIGQAVEEENGRVARSHPFLQDRVRQVGE